MSAVQSFMKRFALLLSIVSTCALFGSTAFAASDQHIHISNNWAGYAALNDTYTGVSATWTIPFSTKTSSVISADAAWIGIGGITKDDLIQVGTQAVIRNGKTQYIAWYELLPDTQRTLALTVLPGDRISASVNEISRGVWSIVITDVTTGNGYRITTPYESTHSSAEWIVERPLAITGDATGYLPLSNFGDVTFENTTATTKKGQMQTVSTSNAEQLLMSNSSSKLIAAPQEKQDDSFTVSYLTPSEGNRLMRTLRQMYTLQPQTNVSSRTPKYAEINTSYVIHVIFSSFR